MAGLSIQIFGWEGMVHIPCDTLIGDGGSSQLLHIVLSIFLPTRSYRISISLSNQAAQYLYVISSCCVEIASQLIHVNLSIFHHFLQCHIVKVNYNLLLFLCLPNIIAEFVDSQKHTENITYSQTRLNYLNVTTKLVVC